MAEDLTSLSKAEKLYRKQMLNTIMSKCLFEIMLCAIIARNLN